MFWEICIIEPQKNAWNLVNANWAPLKLYISCQSISARSEQNDCLFWYEFIRIVMYISDSSLAWDHLIWKMGNDQIYP